MTSKGLGEMFEGDSADTCAGKFPLVSMGGRAEGLSCADLGARTPIGATGILIKTHSLNFAQIIKMSKKEVTLYFMAVYLTTF